MEGQSNSSEVYNYKTLAYSGGTLPRNFKKVLKKLYMRLHSGTSCSSNFLTVYIYFTSSFSTFREQSHLPNSLITLSFPPLFISKAFHLFVTCQTKSY